MCPLFLGNSILDFVNVVSESKIVFKNIPQDKDSLSNANMDTFFFMLYSAYSQLHLSRLMNTSLIFNDRVIFDLSRLIGTKQIKDDSKDVETVLNVTSKAIKLPNISWLVNRSIVPLKDIVKFKNSKKGQELRNFVLSFESNENLAENVFLSLISSLQGKTKWESAWESGVSKFIRIGVSTGIGLIPGVGTALGLGATVVDGVVDKVIPRNYKPTVVLDEMLEKHIDIERIKNEQKKKIVFPPFESLTKRFEPSFYLLDESESRAIIFLDVPGSEEHWEIELDLKDESSNVYFQEFKNLLSQHSGEIQEFISKLSNGSTISEKVTAFSKEPTPSLTIKFTLSRNEKDILYTGGERSFWNFIEGRSYFSNPNAYNGKIARFKI